MRGQTKHVSVRLGWFIMLLVVSTIAINGELFRAEALDRWAGTAVISAEGLSVPIAFTVLVDPGHGASWEWSFQGLQLASGPLSASVSGSTVNGTLFLTGGLVTTEPGCCAPCNFSGTISGNRVDGVFDPASCGGSGTFTLVKQ